MLNGYADGARDNYLCINNAQYELLSTDRVNKDRLHILFNFAANPN
jgi:hypothetical protein